MFKPYYLLIFFYLSTASFPQTKIYSSDKFSLTANSVIEGNYSAIAENSFTIRSDYPGIVENGSGMWKLNTDISELPSYHSDFTLLEALHNLSLEEMKLDIREDGAFMAGAKWTGVWTRDISYSILLSLAFLKPDASKTSLMAKVKDGMIIQDTGTGGSWPCSTDRMVWALAAWEVYKVTGDNNWLKQIYTIIKKSVDADKQNIFDNATGLVRGESSFLDWREQTYPRWMDSKDIYSSINLGTNAVHYRTYRILADIAKLLKKPYAEYERTADKIKNGVNRYLWNHEKNNYNQYLYGRLTLSASERFEALGSSLCVLFDIADSENSGYVISGYPFTPFGAPTIYPQIPNIPNYHNNSVWPFVSAYYTWAASKVNNTAAVENGIASIYRSAALFLTNKENYVAENGDFRNTEINSDRQLWSVAGNLATVYRIFFGLNFETQGIKFTPFIPEAYKGIHTLSGFKYRNAVLDISVEGFGSNIKSVLMDGVKKQDAFITDNIRGKHTVRIILSNNQNKGTIKIIPNEFAPETPSAKVTGLMMSWNKVNDCYYKVYRNGKIFSITENTSITLQRGVKIYEYQVSAVSKKGLESFKSEPVTLYDEKKVITALSSTGDTCIKVSNDENLYVTFNVKTQAEGKYAVDFYYANGSGPINTDNKCAIRTLHVNGKYSSPVVLPQRGLDNWSSWGYSNIIYTDLKKGENTLTLTLEKFNENMNGGINSAYIKNMRVIPVNN